MSGQTVSERSIRTLDKAKGAISKLMKRVVHLEHVVTLLQLAIIQNGAFVLCDCRAKDQPKLCKFVGFGTGRCGHMANIEGLCGNHYNALYGHEWQIDKIQWRNKNTGTLRMVHRCSYCGVRSSEETSTRKCPKKKGYEWLLKQSGIREA